MKIRTVKKALKALRDGRKTPLLKKVRLSNVSYFEKIIEIRNEHRHY